MSQNNDVSSVSRTTRSVWWHALLLAIGSVIVTLLVLELSARVLVSTRWSERELLETTQDSNARSGYISDAKTGYRLEPGRARIDGQGRSFTHNALGFRGTEIMRHKAVNTQRIVLMGASTIYGPYVDDQQTSSAQLQNYFAENTPGMKVEVVNAGVPGWTSRETLLNLETVLMLDPDVIVVMDGRNELFAQLFNNYKDDYSHYRVFGFDFRQSNALHRRIFRTSHLAMLMATARAGDGRLGFSRRASQPAYGYNRWENKPNTSELVLNAQDHQRLEGFRKNLQWIVESAQKNGVSIVLASIPFYAEKFRSGVITRGPETLPYLKKIVSQNNEITREVANMYSLPFVDGASLGQPGLLFDDCHFRPEGERELGKMMGEAIRPLLREGNGLQETPVKRDESVKIISNQRRSIGSIFAVS